MHCRVTGVCKLYGIKSSNFYLVGIADPQTGSRCWEHRRYMGCLQKAGNLDLSCLAGIYQGGGGGLNIIQSIASL